MNYIFPSITKLDSHINRRNSPFGNRTWITWLFHLQCLAIVCLLCNISFLSVHSELCQSSSASGCVPLQPSANFESRCLCGCNSSCWLSFRGLYTDRTYQYSFSYYWRWVDHVDPFPLTMNTVLTRVSLSYECELPVTEFGFRSDMGYNDWIYFIKQLQEI